MTADHPRPPPPDHGPPPPPLGHARGVTTQTFAYKLLLLCCQRPVSAASRRGQQSSAAVSVVSGPSEIVSEIVPGRQIAYRATIVIVLLTMSVSVHSLASVPSLSPCLFPCVLVPRPFLHVPMRSFTSPQLSPVVNCCPLPAVRSLAVRPRNTSRELCQQARRRNSKQSNARPVVCRMLVANVRHNCRTCHVTSHVRHE